MGASRRLRAEAVARKWMEEFYPDLAAAEERSVERPVTRIVEHAFLLSQEIWDCHDHGAPEWPFADMRNGNKHFPDPNAAPSTYPVAVLLRQAVALAEREQDQPTDLVLLACQRRDVALLALACEKAALRADAGPARKRKISQRIAAGSHRLRGLQWSLRAHSGFLADGF